jgi:heat shock protein HslJ
MPRLRPLPFSALALVTLVLAGCGSGSSSSTAGGSTVPTAADLDHTSYISTSIEGHDLVAGTHVSLSFENDSMSANAGCNGMFGPYAVESGRLAWTGSVGSTQMGCPDDLMKQDQWLQTWLQAGADATLDGDTLTLISDGVTLHLQTEKPADAASLLGRTWTVTDLTTPNTATAIPPGVRTPTLEVAADGTVHVDTGCNRGNTTVKAAGDTLEFGPVMMTKMACPGAASDVEQAVLQALEGTVTVTVDGDMATLDNGQHGLMVQLGAPTGS